MSSNSNIPDLEIHESGNQPLRPSSAAAGGRATLSTPSSSQPQLHRQALNIQPHPEIVQKKKEVLQELAVQKQAVNEAKGSPRCPMDHFSVKLFFSFSFSLGRGVLAFHILPRCFHAPPLQQIVIRVDH